eukprot:GEMP01024488.1.p1 GENE.GEMP01024488.1~~GEMP01024488.1.p1  ORF type:complete len:603 (+),score=137.72 GEMP01024488.1:176-1810(+)
MGHRLPELGCDQLSNLHANRIRKVWRQDFPCSEAVKGSHGDAGGKVNIRRKSSEESPPEHPMMDPGREDGLRSNASAGNADSQDGRHVAYPGGGGYDPARFGDRMMPDGMSGYGPPRREQQYMQEPPSNYYDGRSARGGGGMQTRDVENMLHHHEENLRREVQRIQSEQNRMQNAMANLENIASRGNPQVDERLQKRCEVFEQRCASLEQRSDATITRARTAELRAEQAEAQLQKVLEQQMDLRERDAKMIIDRICEVQRVDRRALEHIVSDLFSRPNVNFRPASPTNSTAPMRGAEDIRGTDRSQERWNPRGEQVPQRPDDYNDPYYAPSSQRSYGYEPPIRPESDWDHQPRDGNDFPDDAYRSRSPTMPQSRGPSSPETQEIDPSRPQSYPAYDENIEPINPSSRPPSRAQSKAALHEPAQKVETRKPAAAPANASTLPRVAKTPEEVADWVKGLPDTVLPEKVKEALSTEIESRRIAGDDFTNMMEARELPQLGCQVPLHQARIQKAWKNVLSEEDAKQAVIKAHRENAKQGKKDAVKLIV